jgi:transposase
VYFSCMDTKTHMTHEQKRTRREEIAKAVACGRSISDVAQSHFVGVRTVYDACREFGVEIRDGRKSPDGRNSPDGRKNRAEKVA